MKLHIRGVELVAELLDAADHRPDGASRNESAIARDGHRARRSLSSRRSTGSYKRSERGLINPEPC
jgi:hypothetical protein